MNKEVKRYFVEGPDWELIEDDIGELVEYEDYDALLAEVASLMKWKQTAEYWYGQYRLVKHGESPEQYPTEGKLDDWHNSYHNP